MAYQADHYALESSFPKSKLLTFSKSTEPLSRNREPNMTQNEQVYAICCQPEAADYGVSGQDVETFRYYSSTNLLFRENRNLPLTRMQCVNDSRSTWAPFSGWKIKNV